MSLSLSSGSSRSSSELSSLGPSRALYTGTVCGRGSSTTSIDESDRYPEVGSWAHACPITYSHSSALWGEASYEKA
jgi:hypothetical protein